MALDNILALFLLPLFGALSDRTSTKIGRRMPFILLGTACAAVLMNLLPVLDNRCAAAPSTGKLVGFAAVLGLLLHAQIKSLFTPGMVLIPFVIGALLMIFVERRQFHPRYETLDDMTPGLAFGIGCFQCLALFPGFSRSAATIMGGMILFHGLRRYVLGTCLLAVPGVAALMRPASARD